jgi:hypothetical protein
MTLYFLAGLPRSGSTLLANLLCQNRALTATATSGVIDLLAALMTTWENNPAMVSSSKADINALLGAVLREKYPGNQTYIDKSRGWVRPGIIETMTDVLGYAPKIIATVRPIPDCVASFVRLIKPDDLDYFCKNHPVMQHLKFSYESLNAGFDKYPENILFVEYDNVMADAQKELNRIYDFLELPRFEHTFDAIESVVVEDDEKAWGIADLHTIRPRLQKTAPHARDILGDELFNYFDVAECWNPDKPILPKLNLLNDALDCALRGDFINTELFIDMALMLNADDNRAKFNKGWYELAKGNLNYGMQLIACGRNENVFGNPPPSGMPMWNGQDLTGKTVLLNLEGGLGDQICNARFATNLAVLGARVVLGGAAELATTLMQIDGVVAYAESSCAGGVYHDYWVQAMSAALLLGLEYDDLSGKPYLPCADRVCGDVLRVGIRWAGNPQFEHEQHRSFNPQPLFDLQGVELVSLQKDSDVVIPDHIEQPDLSNWEDTRAVIESLDLVITSCTSVAHMAAAMGKPTWIIVPILPYYLWALPGDLSPWYDSVRLFRQTKPGYWDDVFKQVAGAL